MFFFFRLLCNCTTVTFVEQTDTIKLCIFVHIDIADIVMHIEFQLKSTIDIAMSLCVCVLCAYVRIRVLFAVISLYQTRYKDKKDI